MISDKLLKDIHDLAHNKQKIDDDMCKVIKDYQEWSDNMDVFFKDSLKEFRGKRKV